MGKVLAILVAGLASAAGAGYAFLHFADPYRYDLAGCDTAAMKCCATPTATAPDAATVAAVCIHLDGLPLAIELAAARSKILSPAALLARLTNRLQVLTSGTRDLPARLQTMRDAIAWSYDLLAPEEQAVFRRLAVFVGGFSLEAVTAIAGTSTDVAGLDALGIVASLADQSLVQAIEGPGGEPRYQTLEMVREYGLERLAESREEAATREAHAAYFLDLAERLAPVSLGGPGLGERVALLEAEHANLRAALEHFAACESSSGFHADAPERTPDSVRGVRGRFWYAGAVPARRARLPTGGADSC